MRFSLTFFTVGVLASGTAVQALQCCKFDCSGKRELGGTYAADVYIPATLHERDIVVPSVADIKLGERACCCFATTEGCTTC